MRIWIAVVIFTGSITLAAQPVAVRQPEGEVHGFLVLRGENGAIVAAGDSKQNARRGQIVTELLYRFTDGSVSEETTVFTQNGHFRLVSDHLVQKGPSFKHPLEMTVNTASGAVTVIHTDDKGAPKTETTRMQLPPDLANGMVPVLLKNLAPGVQAITESMIVATPKPMLIKLQIHAEGADGFTAGTARYKAIRYDVHVDIGGLKGAIAPIVGKEPPDTRVWISQGECPTFLKSEGPMSEGGPVCRTELVGPVWETTPPATARRKE